MPIMVNESCLSKLHFFSNTGSKELPKFFKALVIRVDSLFLKVPVLLWVTALQFAKIFVKSLVTVISANQLRHVVGSWSFSGLEKDIAIFILLCKKTQNTFMGRLAGSRNEYESSPVALFYGLEKVFGGTYHEDFKEAEDKRGAKLSIYDILWGSEFVHSTRRH